MDIEIVVIGIRNWTKKGTNDKYFVIDYYRTDNYIPKTDFISALEYSQIQKKLGDKHGIKCTGVRSFNSYDKAYVSDIVIR